MLTESLLARPRALQAFALLLVVAAIYSPLFSSELIQSHDLFFHQRRATEYLAALTSGPNLVPIWSENAIGGNGRPFFLYAAPLVQLLGAGLIAFTGHAGLATNLLCLIVAGITAMLVWLWLRLVVPHRAAFMATIAFITNDYIVRDTLARGALAETTAVAAFAATLWLFERSLRPEGGPALPLAGLSFGLMVLAHNVSLVFMGPAFVAYAVLAALREKRRDRLWTVAAIPTVGMAMASFYWLPAVAYKGWIGADSITSGSNDIARHFKVGEVLAIGYTTLAGSEQRRFTIVPWSLPAVIAMLILLVGRRRSPRHAFYSTMFAATALTAVFITPVTKPLWVSIPFARFVQFPWRVLTLTSIFGAGLSALLFERLRWRRRDLALLGIVLAPTLLSAIYFGARTGTMKGPNLLTPKALRDKGDVSFTFEDVSIPKCVRRGGRRNAVDETTAFRRVPGVEVGDVELGYAWRRARYVAQKPSFIVMEAAHFPLWQVTVDGRQVPHRCFKGRVRFDVPAGAGLIEARIAPSPLMMRSQWLSLATALSLLVWWAIATVRRRRVDEPVTQECG